MKKLITCAIFLMSFPILAAYNCNMYLVMSQVDGRVDLTDKILNKFEAKGYKLTQVDYPSDIQDQGKVSYMTIFSDIHSSFGARTSIKLVDLIIEGENYTSMQESQIKITKKPLIGSAVKSLLRAVEKSIPACK